MDLNSIGKKMCCVFKKKKRKNCVDGDTKGKNFVTKYKGDIDYAIFFSSYV